MPPSADPAISANAGQEGQLCAMLIALQRDGFPLHLAYEPLVRPREIEETI
jgi:hypothetical protein